MKRGGRIRPRRATPRQRVAPRWTAAEWAEADLILIQRAKGRCECCGTPLAGRVERHHRQKRMVGGDRLANLLMLLPEHHQQAHANPTWAVGRGLILRTVDDPLVEPVRYLGQEWMTLGDDGSLLIPPDRMGENDHPEEGERF